MLPVFCVSAPNKCSVSHCGFNSDFIGDQCGGIFSSASLAIRVHFFDQDFHPLKNCVFLSNWVVRGLVYSWYTFSVIDILQMFTQFSALIFMCY